MNKQPLIAYSVTIGDEDPKYDAQSDAYGLEMSFNDELPIELVIVTTPKCVAAIAANTDLASVGVSIGTNAVPKSPHFASNASWLVLDVSDLGGFDIENTRFKCIIHGNDDSRLVEFVNKQAAGSSKLTALAIHATGTDGLAGRVKKFRDILDGRGMCDVSLILYVATDELKIDETIGIEGVNGLYHPSTRFDQILHWINSCISTPGTGG